MIPVKFCTVFVCYMIKVTGSNRLLFLLLTLHRSYLLTDNDIISVHFNSGEKWLQSTTVTLNSNLSGSEPLHSLVSMLLYPLITNLLWFFLLQLFLLLKLTDSKNFNEIHNFVSYPADRQTNLGRTLVNICLSMTNESLFHEESNYMHADNIIKLHVFYK